jgi:glycerophosphoryl diester phosphodiesterase
MSGKILLFSLLFIPFILLFPLFLTNCGPEQSGSDQSLPERGLCAHRGANQTHPENTLAAFKEAIRIGAQMIEFDVQMSGDGKLIIMHDNTVDRTTDGQGKVSDLTLAELKKLDAGTWKHSMFKNERIPTLTETLEMMPTNIWLNIHIKGGADIGKAVAQKIVETNRLHQAVVACKTEAAAAVQQIDKRIKICNMERQENSQQYVNETILMKTDFIQLKERADDLLPVLLPLLKQNGIRVNYYGTNSADKLKRLFAAGIDFPLVDDLNGMMEVAIELGIQPVIPRFSE